jgi:hypothetical protein
MSCLDKVRQILTAFVKSANPSAADLYVGLKAIFDEIEQNQDQTGKQVEISDILYLVNCYLGSPRPLQKMTKSHGGYEQRDEIYHVYIENPKKRNEKEQMAVFEANKKNRKVFLVKIRIYPLLMDLFARKLNEIDRPREFEFKGYTESQYLKKKYSVFYELRHMRNKQGVAPFKEAVLLEAATLPKDNSVLTHVVADHKEYKNEESFLWTRTRKNLEYKWKALAKSYGALPQEASKNEQTKTFERLLQELEAKQQELSSVLGVFYNRKSSQAKAKSLEVLIEKIKTLQSSNVTSTEIYHAVTDWENAKPTQFIIDEEIKNERAIEGFASNAQLMNQSRSRVSSINPVHCFWEKKPTTTHDEIFKLKVALKVQMNEDDRKQVEKKRLAEQELADKRELIHTV